MRYIEQLIVVIYFVNSVNIIIVNAKAILKQLVFNS